MGRGPEWLIVSEHITSLIEQALADPDHPWTVRWPTAGEMASQFGTSVKTISRALNYLEGEGVVVEARVRRDSGYRTTRVPRVREILYRPAPTEQEITTEIIARAQDGEWETLPTLRVLREHFRVDTATITRVIDQLASRRMAHKLRVGRRWRWQIIPPHELPSVDPRRTVSAHRVVMADLIRRIRSGEFRYRLPDGSVHERPFLSLTEMEEQYDISEKVVASVRAELRRLNIIVPGPQAGGPESRARLAERIPTVDLRAHPPTSAPTMPGDRAREIAADLIVRIQTGEFTNGKRLSSYQQRRHYGAGALTVQDAFDRLGDEGWVQFLHTNRGREAFLADPLPSTAPSEITPNPE
jgi:DNA-binding GntR family transcriptional regulator